MGLEVASSLTLVGEMRVSMGPAMSVMLAGWAGSLRAAMMETAANAATVGWHTATTCEFGPRNCRKSMIWAVKSSRVKAPAASGTSRAFFQSVT